MKKQAPKDPDEILPEYDFSNARPNKYAARYKAGRAVVLLEPDVAAAFPTSDEANEALRALAGIIEKRRQRTGVRKSDPKKRSLPRQRRILHVD